ncbi:short-chain dehydrogenase [Aaosphaeria arxii CBS 175.79]|uniref:Short-chain dehydrogenase n=1 Tax=Aaosphaeria arxii CBS 175.79 TaxID=1450172 RepID=A0A6A5XYJ6_9PLEO|nr:short-chain dehydrogenase [Aaosphaeria arxii CBS 175.79]KAF2018385.1 short-chain dehydrogenase [Aaosphaeria arxii CBS 175.79]
MSNFKFSILVTGGTQGMGVECVRSLAQQLPDTLIVTSARTDPKDSATLINKQLNQTNVQFQRLDLSSLAAVRTFVETWSTSNRPPLRALVLNAGIQFPDDIQYSTDGIEKTFAINHVGHALLFHLLTPHLTPTARIVITSSGVHDHDLKGGFKPTWPSVQEIANPSPSFSTSTSGRTRYAISKLANVLWTYALARRLTAQGQGKTVVTFDPGLMPGTNLARDAGPVLRFLWYVVMPRAIPLLRRVYHPNVHTPRESGETLAWLAVGEECKAENGVYYEGRRVVGSSRDSRDEGKQEGLWEWTVGFVGRDEGERGAFGRLE